MVGIRTIRLDAAGVYIAAADKEFSLSQTEIAEQFAQTGGTPEERRAGVEEWIRQRVFAALPGALLADEVHPSVDPDTGVLVDLYLGS